MVSPSAAAVSTPAAAPTVTYLFLLTIALGLGTFIQVLDSSIANVAVAYIAGDLGVSPDDGTWVITSFSISNGIVLALTGWLASRFGGVKLFIFSTALFSVMSWLCGLAWDLGILVFFRILQGASAGALIPLSQSLLLNHYPPDKRGLALGFWSMIVVVAPIMGPVVGGYITDNYGWPWIFYINIPIGFFSAWLTWMLLGSEKKPDLYKYPMDKIGLLLLIVGVSCLQISLDKGEDLDWLNSPFIRIMLTTSIVAFLFFIPWNYYAQYPVMNFSYFKYRNFVLGTALASLGYLMFFGSTVLLPLWLETQVGYNAFWSGVALMPIGLFPIVLSPIVGRYLHLVDVRWIAFFSFLAFSLTFFWFSNLTPQISLYKLMEPRFFQGIGLSLFFIPLITLALAPIPASELAGASGVFNFIRLIAGGGIGTALYVTVWERREIFHHSRLTEITTIYNPLTTQFYNDIENSLQITGTTANQVLENLITQQSYLLAINDVFWLTAWAFLACLPLIWLCQPINTSSGSVAVSE